MSIEGKIIDYKENKQDIEKWIAIKGEQKYLQFIDILEKNKVSCTWRNIDDLCRYDKRLLINVFKYMSFFEDYVRALVWNATKYDYDKLESMYLKDTIDLLEKHKDAINVNGYSVDIIIKNKDYINTLRNHISHNKIMMLCEKNGLELKGLLVMFRESLPEGYQKGFIVAINSCGKGFKQLEAVSIKI